MGHARRVGQSGCQHDPRSRSWIYAMLCVNPQDEQARRDKSGVVDRILAANCLFADLDEGTHFESGLGLVDERGLPYPTAIVKTPNGCHFYWRLEESFSREELPKWSAYQDSLANRLRGDSISKQVDGSMSDYGQIMRLPSFACTKTRVNMATSPLFTLFTPRV